MNRYSLKNFLPLIVIFLTIILATILKMYISHDWCLHPAMLDFMGMFFVIFGMFKIFNLSAFAQAYADYDLIARSSSLYAHLYPFLELALGIFYLTNTVLLPTYIITLVLMLVSAAGVFHALAQHREIECACLGLVFKVPMTYVTLAEDLIMALMALYMIIFHVS